MAGSWMDTIQDGTSEFAVVGINTLDRPIYGPSKLDADRIKQGVPYVIAARKEQWAYRLNYIQIADQCRVCEDDWACAWYLGNAQGGRWLCISCGAHGIWTPAADSKIEQSAGGHDVPTRIKAWCDKQGQFTPTGLKYLRQITEARRAAHKERTRMN